MENKNTKTSGTCQACFGRYAIRGERMVHHGYERPGHGYIVGDCWGVNHKPYELDVALTKSWRSHLADRELPALRAAAEAAAAAKSVVVVKTDYNQPRDPRTGKRPEIKETLTPDHDNFAYYHGLGVRKATENVKLAEETVVMLDGRIASWTYSPEKLVKTARDNGPVIHAPKSGAPGVGLCAMMMSSRRIMYTNPDPAAVTCTRCRARLEARAARAAAKAAEGVK